MTETRKKYYPKDDKPMTDPLPPPIDPDPIGGGDAPWSIDLNPWDFWSQTNDPARDGDPGSGPNAANNCGPEALAMVVAHLTDVVLDADYILDCMDGPDHIGYTSLEDLARYLTRFCRTQVSIVNPQTKHDWLWQCWKELTLNHPSIALFSFSAPGAPDGHFRPIIGMTNSPPTLITADPANATRRVESWDLAWQWAKNPIILVHRSRAIGQ